MTQTNTYKIEGECSNCGYRGDIDLPKGTPFNSTLACPYCGCLQFRKAHPIRQVKWCNSLPQLPLSGAGIPPAKHGVIRCGDTKILGANR